MDTPIAGQLPTCDLRQAMPSVTLTLDFTKDVKNPTLIAPARVATAISFAAYTGVSCVRKPPQVWHRFFFRLSMQLVFRLLTVWLWVGLGYDLPTSS